MMSFIKQLRLNLQFYFDNWKGEFDSVLVILLSQLQFLKLFLIKYVNNLGYTDDHGALEVWFFEAAEWLKSGHAVSEGY